MTPAYSAVCAARSPAHGRTSIGGHDDVDQAADVGRVYLEQAALALLELLHLRLQRGGYLVRASPSAGGYCRRIGLLVVLRTAPAVVRTAGGKSKASRARSFADLCQEVDGLLRGQPLLVVHAGQQDSPRARRQRSPLALAQPSTRRQRLARASVL